jgi:SAM-dependent methyltransferase
VCQQRDRALLITELGMEIIQADIYDYPRYYDLVYGSDWHAEFEFLRACFQRHVKRPVRRVFEPACGTGRLLFRLGRLGLDVCGLDLNPRAVEYCNARLQRYGLPASVFVGDMTRFRLPRKVDAAFNMINSFRHLLDEASATRHLRAMAAAVRQGGIYILGLHLTPTRGQAMDEESWSARRGHLSVTTHLWTKQRDLRKRRERCGMIYDVYTPTRHLRLAGDLVFRTYTWPQFRSLLAKDNDFEIAAQYDFSYDVRKTVEIDRATEDVVFVLRRR